jgi:hypothetical protein
MRRLATSALLVLALAGCTEAAASPSADTAAVGNAVTDTGRQIAEVGSTLSDLGARGALNGASFGTG